MATWRPNWKSKSNRSKSQNQSQTIVWTVSCHRGSILSRRLWHCTFLEHNYYLGQWITGDIGEFFQRRRAGLRSVHVTFRGLLNVLSKVLQSDFENCASFWTYPLSKLPEYSLFDIFPQEFDWSYGYFGVFIYWLEIGLVSVPYHQYNAYKPL